MLSLKDFGGSVTLDASQSRNGHIQIYTSSDAGLVASRAAKDSPNRDQNGFALLFTNSIVDAHDSVTHAGFY